MSMNEEGTHALGFPVPNHSNVRQDQPEPEVTIISRLTSSIRSLPDRHILKNQSAYTNGKTAGSPNTFSTTVPSPPPIPPPTRTRKSIIYENLMIACNHPACTWPILANLYDKKIKPAFAAISVADKDAPNNLFLTSSNTPAFSNSKADIYGIASNTVLPHTPNLPSQLRDHGGDLSDSMAKNEEDDDDVDNNDDDGDQEEEVSGGDDGDDDNEESEDSEYKSDDENEDEDEVEDENVAFSKILLKVGEEKLGRRRGT